MSSKILLGWLASDDNKVYTQWQHIWQYENLWEMRLQIFILEVWFALLVYHLLFQAWSFDAAVILQFLVDSQLDLGYLKTILEWSVGREYFNCLQLVSKQLKLVLLEKKLLAIVNMACTATDGSKRWVIRIFSFPGKELIDINIRI